MSAIDPTGRLLANLRQQAEELRRKHPSLGAGASNSASQIRQSSKDPLSLAIPQILLVDRHEFQAPRQAFRIFLTCVLAQEFGMGVTNDPGFAGLVDRVQSSMEDDPQLLSALNEAGEHLLRIVHGSGTR
jgi:hypothetical protein